MKRVFTYGCRYERRNLTLPDIRAAKAAGSKLSHAFAVDGEDAGAIAAAGIDMVTVMSSVIEEARAAAPDRYIIAALGGNDLVTTDDVLREAMRASIAGADQLHTMRRMEIVELLAKEGFAVMGHVGLVPRKSITTGGLRTFAKTADEALSVLDDIHRLEDAGAVAVEVECVAAEAMAEISRHTALITHGIGSGSGADVIFMFTADICGDNPTPPRHAHAFGDLLSIRKDLAAKRVRALTAYNNVVKDRTFPNESVSVAMKPGEHERLREALESRSPLHKTAPRPETHPNGVEDRR